MKKPKVVIKQPLWSSDSGDAKEIPTEILAQAIVDVAAGVRALRAGPLTDSTLFLLVQHSLPRGVNVSITDIKHVFDGIALLDTKCIKPHAIPQPLKVKP